MERCGRFCVGGGGQIVDLRPATAGLTIPPLILVRADEVIE